MKVTGLDGFVITKVSSSGTEHTAVLTDNGEMLTWYVWSCSFLICDVMKNIKTLSK